MISDFRLRISQLAVSSSTGFLAASGTSTHDSDPKVCPRAGYLPLWASSCFLPSPSKAPVMCDVIHDKTEKLHKMKLAVLVTL